MLKMYVVGFHKTYVCPTNIGLTIISYRVVVQGPGPGPRYGHVMALVGQRYLMAIGGNDG